MAGRAFPEDKIRNKIVMCLENFKYPNDYSVGIGLDGHRVGSVWTENILQGEISKDCLGF